MFDPAQNHMQHMQMQHLTWFHRLMGWLGF